MGEVPFDKMSNHEVEEGLKLVLSSFDGSLPYLTEYFRRKIEKQIVSSSIENVAKLQHQYAFLSELETTIKNLGDTNNE